MRTSSCAGSPLTTDYVALCHWNANIDNAWFWRDTGGLHCGLMDWGCVSQMNLGMAIWGAMSGAETALWDEHFDELLDVFVDGVPPLRRSAPRPGSLAPAHAALRGGDGRRLAAGRAGADQRAVWR